MAEETLEQRLAKLYAKKDHIDQFNEEDVRTLVDAIRDAREHGGTASVDITPISGGGGYTITITDSEGTEHTATVKDGGDAYEVYVSTVPQDQTPMSKAEWLASLKGDTGNDGSDGHNPCLGVFADQTELETVHATATVGDYAYADVTDSTTQTTTKHIFRYNGSAWVDNGEGSPDNQTAFDGGAGPTVAGTKIDNTNLEKPAENALAKARDVKDVTTVAGELGYDDMAFGLLRGVYITNSFGLSAGTNRACLLVDVKKGDTVKIYGESVDASTVRFWVFFNSNNENVGYAEKSSIDYRTEPYTMEVPEGAVRLAVNYANYNSQTDKTVVLSRESVGLYAQSVGAALDGEYPVVVVDNNTTGVVVEQGVINAAVGASVAVTPTSSSTYSHVIIPVKVGEKLKIRTAFPSQSNPSYLLTDDSFDRIVYEVGGINKTISDEQETIVRGNGYLYINVQTASLDRWKVEVGQTPESKAAAVESNISRLSRYKYSPIYHNAILPRDVDTLKILALGNSHTNNSTLYMRELLQAVQVGGVSLDTKVALYFMAFSSASIEGWADATGTYTAYNRGGSAVLGSGNLSGTVEEILAYTDWDIVVIQQYSGYAAVFEKYSALPRLVSRIRANCPNQNVCIAFNMSWGYMNGFGNRPNTGEDMWGMICETMQEMVCRYGVDVIIPTGTAIQNARQDNLSTLLRSQTNDKDLTNDGSHLAPGVAKYVAAGTWYQTLIAPAFNVSILDNPANHTINQDVDGGSAEGEGGVTLTTGVDVTDSNRGVCQRCSFAAVMDMYDITEIEA